MRLSPVTASPLFRLPTAAAQQRGTSQAAASSASGVSRETPMTTAQAQQRELKHVVGKNDELFKAVNEQGYPAPLNNLPNAAGKEGPDLGTHAKLQKMGQELMGLAAEIDHRVKGKQGPPDERTKKLQATLETYLKRLTSKPLKVGDDAIIGRGQNLNAPLESTWFVGSVARAARTLQKTDEGRWNRLNPQATDWLKQSRDKYFLNFARNDGANSNRQMAWTQSMLSIAALTKDTRMFTEVARQSVDTYVARYLDTSKLNQDVRRDSWHLQVGAGSAAQTLELIRHNSQLLEGPQAKRILDAAGNLREPMKKFFTSVAQAHQQGKTPPGWSDYSSSKLRNNESAIWEAAAQFWGGQPLPQSVAAILQNDRARPTHLGAVYRNLAGYGALAPVWP